VIVGIQMRGIPRGCVRGMGVVEDMVKKVVVASSGWLEGIWGRM